MNIFPFSTFFYQIHILQLENYDLGRFLKVISSRVFFADTEKDKDIKWSKKLLLTSLISAVAMFLCLFIVVLGSFPSILFDILVTTLLFVAMSPLYTLFLYVFTALLSPLDLVAKERIVRQARNKLRSAEGLKLIAITGSYGKTTTKEILRGVLSMRYNVIATRDSYNTPVSVSREILERVEEDTEVFIAEMGAYVRGDIEKVCAIGEPDISILTGINEAHLERFGSIENTVETKFEIVDKCAPDGKILLNADDERVVSSYKRHVGNQEVVFFTSENNSLSQYHVEDIVFNEASTGLSFKLFREQKKIGTIETKFLGEYIVGNAILAFIVGGMLGMTDAEIQAGVSTLKPVAHRLSPHKTPNDMIVIDDSYNGNPEGVSSAIKALSRFDKRRKIYITPGLVEVGEASDDIHKSIGEELGSVADMIFLIENSTTDSIKEGLKKGGFDTANLYTFKEKKDAYKKLGQISLSGDVILFQNDWPENYH